MKISAIRSDKVYSKIMNAPLDKKNDIYRYELMKPFEKKWACYSVPMKALTPNGYDVIMASEMLGHIAPTAVDQKQQNNIKLISDNTLWEKCELSIQQSLNCFVEHGVNLPIKEYAFTILLANAKNPYIILNDGYCGDGGIPGYIFSWLLPNEYTLSHLHVALAHETNHNVRFQFIKWKNDITLGEMIVNEGLAENFATFLYGEDKAGPWVTKTDIETLNEYIKPIIRDGLNVQGLENLNAYLYGDEMAALQNYPQVGLPYCSGYACGYHLIKYYLQKTGKNIVEATLLPAKEILNATEDFGMNEKAKTVHEVAKLTGITARTLHYYDEIGLLKPSIITEAKYRQYTDDDLTRLQEILFFREVGFALKEIKELLDSPHYVRSEALERHVLILEAQKERIEALISLVKDTINGNKEIKFSAFSNAKILELQSQFQEEVLEQWGNTESFREYKTMFSSHSKQIQEKEIESFYSMARNIFEKLAMYENSPAESSEVQAIVHEWQQYISEHFYECNKQILSNLGVLYITDERFTTFINRFSSGNLAAFFNEAIQIFCRGSE